jgi:hypothetical protein
LTTEDLKARVLASARATRSTRRGPSQLHVWLVLPSSTIVAAALFFAFDGLHHGQGRPAWFYVASSLGWMAVAALSLWAAFGRGGSALGRSRPWLTAVVVGTPALLFAMMFAFAVLHPEVTHLHPERIGYRCLGLTLAGAVFPLLSLAFIRRGSDPVHPVATGAALGAACGAAAGVMVELWCPVAAPRHVAVGHILPIAIVSVFGALLGARVIAMRARPVAREGAQALDRRK